MGKSKKQSSRKYFDPRDFFPHFMDIGKPELMPNYPLTLGELADEQIKAANPAYWMHVGVVCANSSVSAPWMWYGMMLGTLEAMREGAKSSKKTDKRHKRAVKAVRKFTKHVAGAEAVVPPEEEKPKNEKSTNDKSKNEKPKNKKSKPAEKSKAKTKSGTPEKTKTVKNSMDGKKSGSGAKPDIDTADKKRDISDDLSVDAKRVAQSTGVETGPDVISDISSSDGSLVEERISEEKISEERVAEERVAEEKPVRDFGLVEAPTISEQPEVSVENLSTPLMNVTVAETESEKDEAVTQPIGLFNMISEPTAEEADDLKLISGVGPKLEETLNGLGVFNFAQIAEWTASEIAWVEEYLQFPGRIERDNWIGQAKALAKGGRDEYVKVFGKEPR